MSNNNRILGKKKDELILTKEDLIFLNDLLKNTSALSISNASIKGRFLGIMNKISSLSLTQENLINIFEGLHLGNSESIQNLFTNFNFKKLIEDPSTFINSYQINNSNLSANNKNKFEKLSYIINKDPSNPTPKSKIGKSVLIFFFILSQIVKYIKMKKAIFNGALNRNIRTNSLNINKATEAFNEFKFLAKKFLKMREKIFELTQLQYAEQNIPKDTILYTRPIIPASSIASAPVPKKSIAYEFHYFIYYHFFKNEINHILLKYNKISESILKYNDFIKIKVSEQIKFYSNIILFTNIKKRVTTATGAQREDPVDITFKNNPLNLKVCYKYLDASNYYNKNGIKQTNSGLLDPLGLKPKPQPVGASPIVEPICDFNTIFNINSILYLKRHKNASNEEIYEYNVITKRNKTHFLYNVKAQFFGNEYKIIESKRPKIHFLDMNKYSTPEYTEKYGSIILISYQG